MNTLMRCLSVVKHFQYNGQQCAASIHFEFVCMRNPQKITEQITSNGNLRAAQQRPYILSSNKSECCVPEGRQIVWPFHKISDISIGSVCD